MTVYQFMQTGFFQVFGWVGLFSTIIWLFVWIIKSIYYLESIWEEYSAYRAWKAKRQFLDQTEPEQSEFKNPVEL